MPNTQKTGVQWHPYMLISNKLQQRKLNQKSQHVQRIVPEHSCLGMQFGHMQSWRFSECL